MLHTNVHVFRRKTLVDGLLDSVLGWLEFNFQHHQPLLFGSQTDF